MYHLASAAAQHTGLPVCVLVIDPGANWSMISARPITADSGSFYSKPMLSNALAGKKPPSAIALNTPEQMATQLNATVRAKTRVTALSPAAHTANIGDETLAYSKLVLALGADQIRLPIAGDAANAIITVNSRALDEADARDRERAAGRVRGPLHGIPIAVKDIIATRTLPTTCGSPIYRDHVAGKDAACVTQLVKAGAIVLGKSVTTEFAGAHAGKTHNPHNLRHTPAGSSSGSAAAVADFMAPIGYGTQTSGSVIRPGAFNGVVAYKGTYGWNFTIYDGEIEKMASRNTVEAGSWPGFGNAYLR